MRKENIATFADASFDELCAMRYDHSDAGDFSIMTDTNVVWLSEQAWGSPQKQHIEIPRGIFNRLVGAYLKKRKFVRREQS
jgi:hypothetical protein